MQDIIGFLTLAVPFVSMFVFFGWLYKEEKRKWKKEIQNLRDAAKEVRKNIIFVDLERKSPEEQMQIIELVREQLKDET